MVSDPVRRGPVNGQLVNGQKGGELTDAIPNRGLNRRQEVSRAGTTIEETGDRDGRQ